MRHAYTAGRSSVQDHVKRDARDGLAGRPFDEPIEVDGRELMTLMDAGEYITAPPKKEHEAAPWGAAMEVLLLVVEGGGPSMFARMTPMRALNRHHVLEFNPKGKEPHWSRRKLKRDHNSRWSASFVRSGTIPAFRQNI